jgi:hypothetical protein
VSPAHGRDRHALRLVDGRGIAMVDPVVIPGRTNGSAIVGLTVMDCALTCSMVPSVPFFTPSRVRFAGT